MNARSKDLSPDDIDAFVYDLSEFLNLMLPMGKHMSNFFDVDDNYEPLQDFCLDWFEKHYTRDRNYN